MQSLVTSLACAHLLRKACHLLKEYHILMSFGPALFYINTAFFCIAGLYCFVCLFLWLSVLRQNTGRSIDQEIEMTEKPSTSIEPKPKPSEAEKEGEGNDEAWEVDPPLPNYQQMSKFLATSGLISMLLFFGTLAYEQYWASQTTSRL